MAIVQLGVVWEEGGEDVEIKNGGSVSPLSVAFFHSLGFMVYCVPAGLKKKWENFWRERTCWTPYYH